MLSIGKLGQGQERYYLEAVAEGAEDYYLFAGEAPGRWAGGGTASLGLAGVVAGAAFTSVLTSRHPGTGESLGRRHATGKVPGFDLTFSAPKSVSLLFALGDEPLSRRMRDAHDAAVDDALGYLERTASHGRRGHGGLERVRTSGFVAAVFRHRTSRAGDPNLHSHVVVANRVLGEDGHWSALDARALYVQAKTAGTLYESSLRHQLRDLGLTWSVARSGLAEIDAVPLPVRRAFSRRRQQIEEHLAERGLSSAKAAQAATLQTRAVKDHQVDPDDLRHEWRERAALLGFTPRSIERLLREGRERAGRAPAVDVSVLLGPDGLTAQSSSFGERDVIRAVANAHPDGLPVRAVEEVVGELMTDEEAVELGQDELAVRRQDRLRRRGTQGGVVPVGASERRYSTRELLTLEERLVGEAVASVSAPAATVAAVDVALARRPELSAEQVTMVRRLSLTPEGVVAVEAAAGAGKTTALGALAAACRGSGRTILGTTLSAKAAGVLHDQTGMPTFTTARLLADLRDERVGGLNVGTVLVVDEAGQVGTRAMAELLAAVRRAHGTLVLVGDPHQLPEIDAGGAFRGLLRRLEPVRLTANHRQRDEQERTRLAQLRSGSVPLALALYDEAGRVTRAESGEQLREQLVRDWADAYLSATGDDLDRARAEVVMLGLTNSDVDDLNARAQHLLRERGLVGERELVLGDREFRVGDHVVTRQNDRRLGVLNGQRWRVAELRPHSLLLVPVARVGAAVELPAAYASEHPNWLQHGYALTTAVSQGSSVEQTFVLGSDVTYREAGYTAASRARGRTQFYVVAAEASDLDAERHGGLRVRPEEVDPLQAFVAAMGRSGAQSLALDTAGGLDPSYRRVPAAKTELAEERLRLSRQLAQAPRDRRAVMARLRQELQEAVNRVVAGTAPNANTAETRWSRRKSAAPVPVAIMASSGWRERVRRLEAALAAAQHEQEKRTEWEALHSEEVRRLREVNEELNPLPRVERDLDVDRAGPGNVA